MARNPKQSECREFAEIYLYEAGMNATKAAQILYKRHGKTLKADYKCGSEFLNNEKTQKELARLKQENAQNYIIDRDKLVAKLMDMVDSEETTNRTKLDAIDKLSRMIGAYNDSLEMKGNQTINVTLTD